MNASPSKSPLGFRLIGLFKLVSAVLLCAAGFGIFRLLDKDLGEALESFIVKLRLDPENRFFHALISQVGGINHSQLKAIGAGTFFYAALELVEGVGLILQRHWASYLTVIATALLLPLEIYEITRKVNVVRVSVLLANIVILVYLIVKLRQEHRART